MRDRSLNDAVVGVAFLVVTIVSAGVLGTVDWEPKIEIPKLPVTLQRIEPIEVPAEVQLASGGVEGANELQQWIRSGRFTKALREEGKRELQSRVLLGNFSTPLKLDQLWRLVMLQGTPAFRRLVATSGLPVETLEKLCRAHTSHSPLRVAAEALGIASDTPVVTPLATFSPLSTYPADVQDQLSRSTLRALAATCVVLYEEEHRNRSGV